MLVHLPTRKLVLNLADPAKVCVPIPTAKPFEYAGRTLVAVPHELDETRVLRNLGIKAPSPIKHHYGNPAGKWPGRFDPFFAQRETAAFLTLNERAFVLNDMGCVDASTEYLSPTGWVRMDQYAGGPVAQYHPETRAIEFVEPTEYVKLPCPEMIRFKTKYGVDQLLSPEHRMLIERRDGDGREVAQAADMLMRQEGWLAGHNAKAVGRIGWAKAAIPATYLADGPGLPLSDADLRLQVAVIADGHFPSADGTRCVVRLLKPRKVQRLRQLLDAAGVAYTDHPCAPAGFRRITFRAPRREKVFGADWWAASRRQLQIVADEALRWDGSVARGRSFSTTARESADFVQHAFAATGSVARVERRERSDGRVEFDVRVRPDGKPLMLAGVGSDGSRRTNAWVEPSPDGFKYCFMVPSTFLLFRRNGCIFASGNTGKTLACLWAYDYLRSIGKVRKLLVTCPLSTMERTWGDEIFINFPHLTYATLHGTKERRLAQMASDVDVYIVNHHGLKILEPELLKRDDIDIVCIDEIATFRNASTQLWKALNRIVASRKWRWGMTGTPTPNEPTDAWAQCRLIVPERVPKYKNAFRDSVMKQMGPFKWVAREGATELVAQAMQPAIRFTRDQCVDLPPCVYQTYEVEQTPEQKKAYKQMLQHLAMEADQGQILAHNEGVKASKLIQIATGVVYGNDGQEVVLPCGPRIEVCKEIIEAAGAKVIVFVPFTAVLNYVAEQLGELWPAENARYKAAQHNGHPIHHEKIGVIHGGVSKTERDRIFKAFQSGELQVLVANPGAMSHGLTLTAANTIVWYGPTMSNETYSQANARVTRPGQKLSQLIAHIVGSPIESKAYARLRNRQKMEGLLLETIKGA